MPKIIPKVDPALIQLEPERRVAEALCTQLPSNAVIFHSYPWLRPERDIRRDGEVLREGEADFIVLHPGFGIVVIEVKGGDVFFDPRTMDWGRRGATHEVKDPFEQASKNLRAVEDLLKKRYFNSYTDLPFSRARCVIFPHCEYTGTLPPGADANILFKASDLACIANKIEKLFKLQPYVPAKALSDTVLDGIVQGLTSTFKLVPALWAEIQDQERKIFKLTESQQLIIKALDEKSRVAVKGVAGSGKTMLAMSKARDFADQDKRVLFVCFNEMLSLFLNDQLPDKYKDKIVIRNFHKLCKEWVESAGLKWPRKFDEDEFFKVEAPKLLENAADLISDKSFDSIVADEGQDFFPAWWDSIQLLNKKLTDGDLYIFYDPDQTIFNRKNTLLSKDRKEACIPKLTASITLPINCRNTSKIAGTCGQILGKKIEVNSEAPIGVPPVFVFAEDSVKQKNAAIKQVADWTSLQNKLVPKQIAIITRGNIDKSSLKDVEAISGYPVVRTLREWKSNEGILLTSLYKFKGLEADAMIFVDVVQPDVKAPDSGFGPEHFYVGCSRAKHLLTIISFDKNWLDL